MWGILSIHGASPARVAFLKGAANGHRYHHRIMRDFSCSNRHHRALPDKEGVARTAEFGHGKTPRALDR